DLVRTRDLAIVRAVIGPALLLEQLIAEEHILGCDRYPVGKPRLRAQVEGDGATVVRQLHALRYQSVKAEGLIAATRHQTLIDIVAQVGWRDAFDDEWIEAVEGAKRPQHQPAALRGFGVGVGEICKAGRVLGVAVHGDGVHRLPTRWRDDDEASEEANEGSPCRQLIASRRQMRGLRPWVCRLSLKSV